MSSNLKIRRICAWCGKEFIAQKTTTACCSKQCANALYKKRKRDEAIKTNNQFVEKKIEEKPIERIKNKPFLTITETAIYLGVTRPTVYGYIKRGELKVSRLGFKYFLKKEDIDKLFNTPIEFHTPIKEKAPSTPPPKSKRNTISMNRGYSPLPKSTASHVPSTEAKPIGARNISMPTLPRKPLTRTSPNGTAHRRCKINSA